MKRKELFEILLSEKPSILLKEKEEIIFSLIPELKKCKGFNQNSRWHTKDVYEHILSVVDNTPPNIILRLAALFHDIAKPFCYKEDDKGGHFYNHWQLGVDIFLEFAKKLEIEEEITKSISKLIFYHDLNLNELNDKEIENLKNKLRPFEINLLFHLKKADLLSQSEEYHYLLDDYEKWQRRLLKSSD